MLSLVGVIGSMAQEAWTPETLPMVYLHDRTKYVINPEGILSQQVVDTIDAELYTLEQEMGVQTVVAVVKHIEGDDPYEFGQAVADKYGIGHKGKDDGLFIMLCTEDRSYTILTGDGLEGTLPDAICSRIQNRVMVPLLKESKWDDAMLATIRAIDKYIRGDEEFKKAIESDDDDDEWLAGLLLFGGIMGGLGALVYYGSRKKCTKCGKRKMRAVSRKELPDQGGMQRIEVTYRCSNCGTTMTRIFKFSNNNNPSGFGGPVVGGGMGSIHSGGPIGGHFGGGHFSGGGSTGRF